jgi:hypothetical protein
MLPERGPLGVLTLFSMADGCVEPVESSPESCTQVDDAAESSRAQSIFLSVCLHNAYHREWNRHASGIGFLPSSDGTRSRHQKKSPTNDGHIGHCSH